MSSIVPTLPLTDHVNALASAPSVRWFQIAPAVRVVLLPGVTVSVVRLEVPFFRVMESGVEMAWTTVLPLAPRPLAVTVMSPPPVGVVKTSFSSVPALAVSV